MRQLILALLAVPITAHALDLKAGDTLPDCSKIPLLSVDNQYKPQPASVESFEKSLLSDGVAIVHFCSPRPPRGSAFETSFVEQLSDLQKAAQSVSYPCNAMAVVPYGEKGKQDALLLISQSQDKPWGNTAIYYEPTFPRPGLYRTFRNGVAADGTDITTPWTYIIGPGRKILAVRDPESKVKLYDWLQQNLPATVTAVAKDPSTNISEPNPDTWVWPSFGRSATHQPAASMLPDVLPYTYLAWQTTIGRTFASPAVVDNVVYINTDSQGLQTLSLANGRGLQKFNTGKSWWTSPVVAANIVYSINDQGVVHAIDRGTFNLRWRTDLRGLVTSSPIVAAGSLFVGSRNGSVYALDASTGEVLWRFQTGGEISSSPALTGNTLLIGSGDRSLYAIESRSGALKWSAPTEGPVDSSPTIVDGDVFVGSFDGSLYSFKLADGTQNWKCPLGGWVHSSPAVEGDRVFAGTVARGPDTAPSFNWVDRKTGKRLGFFDVPDSIYSSPTIWGDLVLIGCRDHNLYAFDRQMRQQQPAWTYKTRSYIHASPVVVGDTVLVASFEGDLYALRQSKPIRNWKDDDIVPRWFVAAMSREMHKEVGDLILRASAGKVNEPLKLRKFEEVFGDIKGGLKGTPPKILPGDVQPEHPGALFIEYALTASLLTGYPDGSFRPNEPTTRYQFAFGLSTVTQTVTRPDFAWKFRDKGSKTGAVVEVQIQPVVGRSQTMPRDVPQNHWAFAALRDLSEKAVVPVDEDGSYKGGKILTLKDAAAHWALMVEALKVIRTK